MIDPERYPSPEAWSAFLKEDRKPTRAECERWGLRYPAPKGWQTKMSENVNLAHNALPHLRYIDSRRSLLPSERVSDES